MSLGPSESQAQKRERLRTDQDLITSLEDDTFRRTRQRMLRYGLGFTNAPAAKPPAAVGTGGKAGFSGFGTFAPTTR